MGDSAHYVAVRPDRDPQPVRRFECFTAYLHRLANRLQSSGVKTVALQSTGNLAPCIRLYRFLRLLAMCITRGARSCSEIIGTRLD